MLDTTTILKSILGLLGSAVLFYVVGLLANYLLGRKKVWWGWLPTYFYFLCGMLLSVSGYALFKTQGQTILAVIPLLLIPLIIAVNKQCPFRTATDAWSKAGPFVFLLVSVSLAYIYYALSFRVNSDTLHYIWGDQEYYTRVAENISFLGIENMRIEYLYPERFTVEPFHYGDIWSIALATTLGTVKPIFGGALVSFPLLMGMISLGMATVVQTCFPAGTGKNYFIWFLLPAALIGGFACLFPAFIFPGSVDVYARSLSNYTKLLWWASILPLIFTLVCSKKDGLIFYVVFIIGIGYINVLPALAMGSFFWVTYISYRRKELLPNLAKVLITGVLMIAFVYAFYIIVPSWSAIKRPLSGKADFNISSIIANLRTSLNIFIGGALQLLVYAPPFILLLLHFWLEKIKLKTSGIFNLVVCCSLVVGSSLFVWAILFTTTMEAVQFFYNVFVVVFGLLSAVIYIYLMVTSGKTGIKIAAVVLILLSLSANLSYSINVNTAKRSEVDNLYRFVAAHEPKTFAYYKQPQSYTTDFFSSGTLTAMPYSILQYKIDHYENFSLNAPFARFDTTRREYKFQKSNIDWAPISYFVKMERNQGLSEDELMQKFMRENRIGFLCVPDNMAVPASLQAFTIDSLHTPGMGWKIYSCSYQ